MRRALIVLLVTALAAVGCGDDDSSDPPQVTNPSVTTEASPVTTEALPVPDSSSHVSAYVETWNTDTGVVTTGRTYLAFADVQADGSLVAPNLEVAQPIIDRNTAAGASTVLSIGGWGDDAVKGDHERILTGFQAAAANPDQFVADVLAINDQAVDIDWEYPQIGADAQGLVTIVQKLKAHGLWVSLAVAANPDGEGAGIASIARQLAPLVDRVNIMTYDVAGSWSDGADHAAPGDWVIDMMTSWKKHFPAPGQLSVGFPAYGVTFIGALQPGDTFDTAQKVSLADILSKVSADDIVNDQDGLTSSTYINGSWTTFTSPAIATAIMERIHQEVGPDVTPFIWSANTASQAFVDGLASAA